LKAFQLIFLAYFAFAAGPVWSQSPYVDFGHEPVMVSLLQILANPAQHHGKEVQFVAYLNLEFESDTLWLHREDRANAILGNSIWVAATPEMEKEKSAINRKYVLIRGVFNANMHGHLGMHAGTLTKITKCVFWSDQKHPRGFLTPPPPPPPPPLPKSKKRESPPGSS